MARTAPERSARSVDAPPCRPAELLEESPVVERAEHAGELVFLHAVKPGPANQSYGLQVASLAGVPPDVIRRARAYLATLESQQALHSSDPQVQLPLGPASDDSGDALREAVDDLDPDAMTPRQALDALYRLKDM